jgi:transcriptional regulator with XRE-family HTH domain
MTRAFSGAQARELRKDAELRIERVAIDIDRSVYAMLSYENNRSTPPAAILAALADLYGCAIDDFFAAVPGE